LASGDDVLTQEKLTMDRFDTEPRAFYDHQARLLRPHLPRRIDDMNVSELEVFMLRGRRLQARAMGDGIGWLFGKLRRPLRGSSDTTASGRQPDCRHVA
jgi:hypothetical protein